MAFHPDCTDIIPEDQLPENVQEIYITTEDNIKLQSYLLPHQVSDKLLIYFHGNGGNIGHRLSDLQEIQRLGINVLGLGYRGYGNSQGKPSEEGIYLDGKATLRYAQEHLGFSTENIFILGRSIGTTVAVNTSQQLDLAGLILVTPLTNAKEHAKATGLGLISFMAGKAFDNIGKIRNMSCPTLVIHGTRDDVIPFSMGQQIYNALTTEKKFATIEGGDHNNLSTEFQALYWKAIGEFISPGLSISSK